MTPKQKEKIAQKPAFSSTGQKNRFAHSLSLASITNKWSPELVKRGIVKREASGKDKTGIKRIWWMGFYSSLPERERSGLRRETKSRKVLPDFPGLELPPSAEALVPSDSEAVAGFDSCASLAAAHEDVVATDKGALTTLLDFFLLLRDRERDLKIPGSRPWVSRSRRAISPIIVVLLVAIFSSGIGIYRMIPRDGVICRISSSAAWMSIVLRRFVMGAIR